MFKICFCQDIPEDGIHKIGAMIISDRKLLVVRKRGKNEFIIPGGKHEKSETSEECLKRELKEELQIDLISSEFFSRYEGAAHFEKALLVMDLYFVKFKGDIKVDSEIKEFLWIDRNYKDNGVSLAGALEFYIVPKLTVMGLI